MAHTGPTAGLPARWRVPSEASSCPDVGAPHGLGLFEQGFSTLHWPQMIRSFLPERLFKSLPQTLLPNGRGRAHVRGEPTGRPETLRRRRDGLSTLPPVSGVCLPVQGLCLPFHLLCWEQRQQAHVGKRQPRSHPNKFGLTHVEQDANSPPTTGASCSCGTARPLAPASGLPSLQKLCLQ